MAHSAAAELGVLLSRVRPPAAAGLRRDRLLRSVGSSTTRLCLLMAPAGTGKTTVLGQLAGELTPNPAWLTLDGDLRSVPAFLSHLWQSFADVLDLPADRWCTAVEMINTLDALLPAGAPTVLILDDLHLLAGAPALDVVRMVLANQPTQLRLVMAGRTMPELGLAKYSLSNQVCEIGAADLQFRPSETSELIDSRPEWRQWTPLSTGLHERTGGWAVALQIYLSVGDPVRPLAASDAAANRLINRYLVEQVRDQPADSEPVALPARFVPAQRSTEPEAVARGQLRIDVLGTFAITVDGTPLETSSLRPLHRELLALFCAFAGRVVQRDQLTEWFWPDRAPERATHNLQVAVSELRRLLDAGQPPHAETRLCREGSGYRLRLGAAADCDARYFEQLLQLASVADRRGDRERAASHLESALSRYRGDLLLHIGYPEWVLAERDRLRQLVGAAYDQLVTLRVAAGQHREAVTAARAGLTHDRHRDGLWRQLVDSLLAIDEPAAASAARRNYQALLADLDVPEATNAAYPWGVVA